jgi:hypothetical protein
MNLSKIIIKLGIATTSLLSVVQPASAILYNRFKFIDFYGNINSDGNVDWDASLSGNAPGKTITGTIGFDETLLDLNQSGANIPATSLVIDSVPSYFHSIWDNTNFGIGKNLIGAGNSASSKYTRTYNYFSGVTTGNSYASSNSFELINGVITGFKFEERFYLDVQEPSNPKNEQYEWIVLGGATNENSLLDPVYDTFDGTFPGNFLEITYPLNNPLFTSEPITYSDVFVYDFDDNITFNTVPESAPGFGLLFFGGIWVISRFRQQKLF